ncbi:MAG TPA: sugar phosphate nucleotidyltransferase [Saprospiraceae bacterium]|nr:sugar phosphate nucleotidyltransferase [Saprospiraceae bacterium]
MKAVIPVAGAGTNLRPHTYTQPKPLIPVAGKPIIAFILDDLIAKGVRDFVFIIGYLGEKIKLYVEKSYPDISVEWVQQETRMGLGHAIWTARHCLQGVDEIVIHLGDTIVDADLSSFLNSPYSCLGIKKVSDPRLFGVVELDHDGFVSRVIEKPSIPKSNLAMVGLYKIKEVDVLIESIDYHIQHGIKTRNEFQLTDALMRMISQGIRFTTLEVFNWFDCGQKDILLETNATLLDRKNTHAEPPMDAENTIIIHPVSIGANCQIKNSIIGPHVTIGNDSNIDSAIIRDSIIGSYTSIQEAVLYHSIVGHDAAIKGMRQSLNIGDNTQIDLG